MILDFIKNAKWIILAAVVSLIIGFAGGWYEKGIHIKAKETDALQQARKNDAQNITQMYDTESKIDDVNEDTEQRFKVIYKEVVKYVPKTVYKEKPETVTIYDSQFHPSDCGSDTLTVHAVGLLNSALQNRDYDATAISDEEGQTATNIGLREIVQSEVEVAEQYHELATNHNACVDYVQSLIDKQNEQLNN